MLFEIKDKKAKSVPSKDFSLEKDLQSLIEHNLNEIFGLDFLKTEFPIEDFRYDSVAYDSENNTFIIIEYKKGRNESLVDQGYAYISTALSRKSDLVLLYNEVKKESKQIKDFDWEAIRIYFISPKFTDYQRAATKFKSMPFKLFEVSYYENGCLMVNEINTGKVQFDVSVDDQGPSGTREVKVYTENDHLSKLPSEMVEIYEYIREKIMELPEIVIVPRKNYIAFKRNNSNICDIEFWKAKKQMDVYINVNKGHLDDPSHRTKDVSNVGHHGNGDYILTISKEEDVDYLISLVKQSYKINS